MLITSSVSLTKRISPGPGSASLSPRACQKVAVPPPPGKGEAGGNVGENASQGPGKTPNHLLCAPRMQSILLGTAAFSPSIDGI